MNIYRYKTHYREFLFTGTLGNYRVQPGWELLHVIRDNDPPTQQWADRGKLFAIADSVWPLDIRSSPV